jgi:hypothetical protein
LHSAVLDDMLEGLFDATLAGPVLALLPPVLALPELAALGALPPLPDDGIPPGRARLALPLLDVVPPLRAGVAPPPLAVSPLSWQLLLTLSLLLPEPPLDLAPVIGLPVGAHCGVVTLEIAYQKQITVNTMTTVAISARFTPCFPVQ